MTHTNKWQWWFKPAERRMYVRDTAGWRMFEAGLIKIHTMPPEGCILQSNEYHGFIIRFMWWLPIDRV